MQRCEIWWANLPPPAGPRPVLLLSREVAYRSRRLVTVALVTTRIRGLPVEVPVGREEGLPREGVVNLDNITTIDRLILAERVSLLSPEKMRAVNDAIRFALDLGWGQKPGRSLRGQV